MTRFEIIDENGRFLSDYVEDMTLDLQDNGRTLKAFLRWRKPGSAAEQAHRLELQRDLAGYETLARDEERQQ